eukprot:gnl/Spiro4/6834_TR3540_c0_g1_i1.p1 gnl/Spiro4/6834_TR3540_c0_g1~~gnl/Spiro4/6834_TR3540_c0_g1_i1.p1  ORF type:complete len:284 (+),score=53.30 gnl/Spiro4/6834_TR3540_c0_g1_i1:91-942(+)
MMFDKFCRPYTDPRVKEQNWNESGALIGLNQDHFQQKLSSGTTVLHQTTRIASRALQSVDLESSSSDGVVHYGDCIMLVNEQSSAYLTFSNSDQVPSEDGSVAVVTTSAQDQPLARNVFQIVRYPEQAGATFPDNIVRYGDKFCLLSHPAYTDRPLFLHSQKLSPSFSSKTQRQQLVGMCQTMNYRCAWTFLYFTPQFRLEAEGQVVQALTPLVISHCATRANLSSGNVPYRNEFGVELEVWAASSLDAHRAEPPESHWSLVAEYVPAPNAATRTAAPPAASR